MSLEGYLLPNSDVKRKKQIFVKGDKMANKKQTSKSVASKASKALRSKSSSKTCKSLAGSALSQTRKGRK